MAEIKTQQFTVEPDPGDPTAELSLRKLDPYMTPVAQIAFGNDSNTYLSFQSYVGGSMSEQMRVHTNGNVGIGTAAPGEKLEVAGTVKATAFDGNLNGSQITTGTVAAARIDTAIVRTSSLAIPNGIATLDSNTLVVQDPANATATPTAGKIPIANTSGKLAAGWGGNASTLATLDANTRLVQPANTVWDGAAGRSASPTPAANTVPVSGSDAKLAWGWKPGYRGCAVQRTTTQTIPSGTYTALNFQTELYDTDSIHDNGTNNTRLTVPPGVTKVRLFFQGSWVGAINSTVAVLLFKNNSAVISDQKPASTAASQYLRFTSPKLDVASGEYFEVKVYQSTGSNRMFNWGSTTYFEMEIIE